VGVSDEVIGRLKEAHPSLTVAARRNTSSSPFMTALRGLFLAEDALGPVSAVKVTIDGIRGGGKTTRVPYELIVETMRLRSAIPAVWVMSPEDSQIEHVNIWRAHKSHCRWSGTDLPSLCWDSFGTGWMTAEPASRTLGAALEYVKQLLNTENHDSPAR
jgi:hypothetical protein